MSSVFLGGAHGGSISDDKVLVLAHTGTGRDEVSDDDVLLHADQCVAFGVDGCLGEDLGGLLEGCSGDEGFGLQRGASDALENLTAGGGVRVACGDEVLVLTAQGGVLVAQLTCGDNLTDGEVFADPEGKFTEIREKLKAGFPEEIRFLKLAEDCAKVSQTGQYNYFRMISRGDRLTADAMLMECTRHVCRLWHHLCNAYAPHDKWLVKSTERLPGGDGVVTMLEELHKTLSMDSERAKITACAFLEELCGGIAKALYDESLISDVDPYLDHQVEELLMKASYAKQSDEELVRRIAKTEFEAFDKVKNEGGRASCQNDWPTFSVMRKSQ